METSRLYISPTFPGSARYDGRLNAIDGEQIITGATEPLFDAARILHSRGLEGRLEMWDVVTPYARMSGVIAKLAKMAVREGNLDGPRFCRFQQNPHQRVASGQNGRGPHPYRKTQLARLGEPPATANGLLEPRAA